MLLETNERRPASNEAASQAVRPDDPIFSPIGDARQRQGDIDTGATYALFLDGVRQRRVYLGNLRSAEGALARARARGEDGAHLVLVKLTPMGGDRP